MSHRVLGLTFALALAALAPADAAATVQRTFVASTGNDANPCSLAQPCRGFARAISQTSASGEVIVLDSAGYGPVTITKSVSLIAPAGIHAGITVFSGDGITVNVPNGVVVLRGLTISGQGGANGIFLLAASRLRIENCVISNMGMNGVLFSATASELIVIDTIVRDNGASGIGGDSNAFVVLDHVRSEHNGTHGFYMATYVGGQGSASISDSVFALNGSNGIWVGATDTSYMFAQIERSVATNNGDDGIRITAQSEARIGATVTRNAVARNAVNGILVNGPGFASATISENAIVHYIDVGVHANGSNTLVWMSANSFGWNRGTDTAEVVASNGSTLYSAGNNVGVLYADAVPVKEFRFDRDAPAPTIHGDPNAASHLRFDGNRVRAFHLLVVGCRSDRPTHVRRVDRQ